MFIFNSTIVSFIILVVSSI